MSTKPKKRSKPNDIIAIAMMVTLVVAIVITPFLYKTQLLEGGLLIRYRFLGYLGYLGAIFAGVHHFRSKAPLNISLNMLFLGAFVAWSFLSFFWAENQDDAYLALLKFGVFPPLFLTSFYYAKISKNYSFYVVAFTFVGFLLGVMGVLQILGVDLSPYRQITTPGLTFHKTNGVGHVMVGLVPLALGCFLLAKNKTIKWFSFTAFLLVVLISVFSKARANWAGVAVGLAIIGTSFFPYLYSTYKRFLPLLIIPVVTVAALLFLNVENAGKSIEKKLTLEDTVEASISFRGTAQLNSLGMLLNAPLQGVGLGNFRSHFPKYFDYLALTDEYTRSNYPVHLHNDILEIFCELGLIGGVLFLLAVVVPLFRSTKISPAEGLGDQQSFITIVAAALAAILVASLFTFPLNRAYASAVFWILLGIFYAMLPDKHLWTVKSKQWRFLVLGLTVMSTWVFSFHKNVNKWIDAAEYLYISKYFTTSEPRLNDALQFGLKSHETYPLDYRTVEQAANSAIKNNTNLRAAKEIVETRLAQEPFNPNLHTILATIQMLLKDYAAAEKSVVNALDYCPPDPSLYYILGNAQVAQNKKDKAASAFKQFLMLQPKAPSVAQFKNIVDIIEQLEGPGNSAPIRISDVTTLADGQLQITFQTTGAYFWFHLVVEEVVNRKRVDRKYSQWHTGLETQKAPSGDLVLTFEFSGGLENNSFRLRGWNTQGLGPWSKRFNAK